MRLHLIFFSIYTGLFLFQPAYALSLTEATVLARDHDPEFISAKENLIASEKRSSQALAGLLPQLTGTAGYSGNYREYTVDDDSTPPGDDSYRAKNAQLNLNQVLWNRPNFFAYSQAKAAIEQARHQLAAAEQDLLLRLAQAWFDMMTARDASTFSEKQLTAAQHQLAQTTRGVSVGLSAPPVLEEIRAKHAQAQADRAAAEADQHMKLAALEQIIGPLEPFVPPSLSVEFETQLVLDNDDLNLWLTQAEQGNPNVLAAQSAVDAATYEVKKQRAGHDPTLELVGSYGRNIQGAGSSPGQPGFDSKQRSLGVQLSLPIFTGGGQMARSGEAIAMRNRAQQELEAARQNARAMCKHAWFGQRAGTARHKAAAQRAKYLSIALMSAKSGTRKGLKSELDVLQTAQELYAAFRDVHTARYEMVLSYLKLKAATGELSDTDLTELQFTSVPDESEATNRSLVQPTASVKPTDVKNIENNP